MVYAELPPPPSVSPFVRCFWFLRGTFSPTEPQTVVSDGRIEIILHLANPFSRIEAPGQAAIQDKVVVSGQITRPVRVHGNGEGDLVGIRFRTSAASALFRLPIAELTDRVESLDAISRPLSRALAGAGAQFDAPHDRVRALSVVLEGFTARSPDRAVGAATRHLDGHPQPSVHDVARTLGFSVRTLERRVLDATGLSPAVLRRVLRFRRAYRLLDATPRGRWGAVAAHAGYTDQAHLIRDFRQFAGATPTDFFQSDPALASAIMAAES
jgi:AraC-like DNA-binding protein